AAADDAHRLARGVTDGDAAHEHRAIRAVSVPESVLELELRGLASEVRPEGLFLLLHVLRVRQADSGGEVVWRLGAAVAELLTHVAEDDAAVRKGPIRQFQLPDTDVRCVD